MTQERLMNLIDALINLALDATDDAALVESYIRALGFSDDELRALGFDC